MKVTIVGVSGAIGQEFLRISERRKLPLDELILFGSQCSTGTTYLFRGKNHEVKFLQHSDDFKDVDTAFVSVGDGTSKEFADITTKHGTIMIDNSSAFRMNEDVSLVVPKVNTEDVLKRPRNIIVNPDYITIMIAAVLKPIDGLSHIKRVRISPYQSTSGASAAAMTELQQRCKELVETSSAKIVSKFPHRPAYNVIPQVDMFVDNEYTKEEMKMFNGIRKIMHSDVKISATCVRVSPPRSHSESVWLETGRPLFAEEVRQAIATAPGCVVKGDPTQASCPMPLESAGHDDVYVGRIRKNLAGDNSTTLQLASNQIRREAALGTVQIAGYLIKVGNAK